MKAYFIRDYLCDAYGHLLSLSKISNKDCQCDTGKLVWEKHLNYVIRIIFSFVFILNSCCKPNLKSMYRWILTVYCNIKRSSVCKKLKQLRATVFYPKLTRENLHNMLDSPRFIRVNLSPLFEPLTGHIQSYTMLQGL